jgi:hypothetical protein
MKFLVETDQNITVDGIIRTLGIQGVFTKVTELPEIKQPQMIEAGILMSPAEITGCIDAVEVSVSMVDNSTYCCSLMCSKENIGKRLIISQYKYPRSFYRKDSIQTFIDWGSIKVGSLVEIVTVDKPNSKFVGFNTGTSHPNEFRIDCGYAHTFFKHDEIKSIRVIEEAK